MSELQSMSNLLTMSSGYRTIATGIQPNFASPLEGFPLPGGANGQLLSLALGPTFQNLMSKAGMTGMGLGHDQNIYDRFQAQQQQTQMQEQLRNAAQLDRSSFMNTMQGAAALMGVPMGGQQRLAANRLADLAVSGAPNIAQAYPEILDQLGGSRGSATVMTSKLANFGRYRMDPITGQMGTDPKSTQALASNIMDDMYSAQNLSAMKGISAGQLGSMAESLSLRGLVGGSEFGREGLLRNLGGIDQTTLMARAQAANGGAGIAGVTKGRDGAVDLSKISASDLDKLTSDTTVSSKLRDFDANKIKTSLQSYVGAMAAMRDIFGDAGHPNAPIPALMQALEGMTSGAMGQVDPSKLGQMARQTYYLAKTAGISADSAMVMQQDAAVRGQQLGIESPFAIQATQSSLGFNAAMRAKGALATPVFGGMTESALTQANSNMFQQGVASNFGTKLGTLLRIQDKIGAAGAQNTDLGKALAAINKNEETVMVGGRTVRVQELTNSDIETLGVQAGMTKNNVQQMLLQAPAAREALMNSPQSLDYIRNVAQPAEIRTTLSRATSTILNSAASERGINTSDPAISKKLDTAAATIIADLSKQSAEVNRDPIKREAFIAARLEQLLPPDVLTKIREGQTADQAKENVRVKGLASVVSANLDTTVKNNMTGYNTYADVSTANDPATLAASAAIQQNQANQNKARDVTSGIGQASGLRGLMNAMKDVDIKDPNAVMKVIAKTFGGIDTKRIGTALEGPLGKFKTSQEAVDKALHLLNIADPKERPALQADLDAKMKNLQSATEDLRTKAEAVNAYSEKGLTGSDVAGAETSVKSERLSIDNMTVLRTAGMPTVATKKQIETAQKEALAELKEKVEAKATDSKVADSDTKKIEAKALLVEINKGNYTVSEGDALARIAKQRKSIKNATSAEIDEVAKKYGIEKEQADELEAVRRNALRAGIDEDAIKAANIDTTTKGETAVNAQITGMRKLIDAKDTKLSDEAADKMSKAFKTSKDAPKLRDARDATDLDVRNVVTRALDAGTMTKVGVSVAKDAEKLETTRQQMTNMVEKATKGNLGDFFLSNFAVSDEDAKSSDEKQAFRQKLRTQYGELNKQSEEGLVALKKRLESNAPNAADAALSEVDKKTAIETARKKKEVLDAPVDKLIEQYKTVFKIDSAVNTDELKKSLNTHTSKSALADIIGTQERISAVSSDTTKLKKDYADAVASKDPKALEKFKADYKLDTEDKFRRTATDLDTMNIVDFDKFKGADGAKNLNENLKVLGGSSVVSAGRNDNRDINVTGKLTGEFKLTGDTVTTLGDCDLTARSIA